MRASFPFVPAALKSLLVPIACRLPLKMWVPPLYWETARMLAESEWWDEERLREYQTSKLREMLRHCAKNVPHYRRLFRKLGFDPDALHDCADLSALPLLEKDELRARPLDFVAENIPRWQRGYYTTGGTTGKPLAIYNHLDFAWRERAFIDAQWRRVGFKPGALRAVLRGAVVKNRRHWAFDPKERAVVFSNFHLTAQNAAEYATVMKARGAKFLHCYPSAGLDFARLLGAAHIAPPVFTAVLAGSENIYPGQREQIESFYGCRMFTWYGHTEALVLAGECEHSSDYHVMPQYGVTELVTAEGRAAAPGEAGEIVGSTLYNFVMPLVRYRTGDSAVRAAGPCSCGRKYERFKQVRGRWLQEMLVGRAGEFISVTALNMHSDVFDHVQHFQFYQREKGVVELSLVRASGYTENDSKAILATLGEKMGHTIEIGLTFKDKIPLSPRGKFRFVVQELPVLTPEQEGGEVERSR